MKTYGYTLSQHIFVQSWFLEFCSNKIKIQKGAKFSDIMRIQLFKLERNINRLYGRKKTPLFTLKIAIIWHTIFNFIFLYARNAFCLNVWDYVTC